MKTELLSILVLFGKSLATAQGTFVYDQQSSDESLYKEGSGQIQQSQPLGQSFTPSLSAVGFVRITIGNGLFGDYSQANVVVNLRSNSITGSLLGVSQVVTIPGGNLFYGTVDFIFSTPIAVDPGVTYFFQPDVLNNNNLGINGATYNYPGGVAFVNGVAVPSGDLWFREGIIIPEPSALVLLLVGVAMSPFFRRLRK